MPEYIDISGRTVSGLTVSAGTYLEIGSGGVAIDTLVKDGGYEVTASGGITSGAVVRAGGSELVDPGGTAIIAGVKDGGYVAVLSGGTAISAQISAGGTMIVSAGGTAVGTGAGAGAFVSVTSVVSAGQTVSGLRIGSDTALDVLSGGTAVSTTVTAGGLEAVVSGGSASGTTVSSGGSVTVGSGGSAAGTVVSAGGYVFVSAGGWASGTTVSSGGSGHVNLVVTAGQTSSGLILDRVTQLSVDYGGVTTGTIITSGGYEFLQGGTDIGARIGAGGYEAMSGGTALDPVIMGGLEDAVGVVSGAVITGNGVEDVSFGLFGFGVASDTTITGSGMLEIQDGGSASGTIDFGEHGRLTLDTGPTFAMLSGFNAGNSIELGYLSYTSGGTGNFSDGDLVVSQGGTVAVLQFAGNYSGASFNLTSAPFDEGTIVTVSNVPCFAAGTRIETDRGAVPVERLAVGDRVLTVDGTAEPILWIGSRTVDCRRHPEPEKVWPVRIAAHTFGAGRPGRDLFLSPDHAIFAEGVLIPVKHLINGSTIAQVVAAVVRYFHVELACHAVILAEGLPAESYLDTGDQRAFARMEGVTMLHPAFGCAREDLTLFVDALGYAPLRVTGPEVERVRAAVVCRGRDARRA